MIGGPSLADAQQQAGNGSFTLKVQSDIVLTNVVARDRKTGALVKDLKASDFTIFENGKPQKIESFDYQNADQAVALNEKNTVTGKTPSVADMLNNNFAEDTAALRDHRLIVMFFDLSSMQPEDIDRAVDAAKDYISKKMQPADLVALVSMATGLSVDQDFTADKTVLLGKVGAYNGTEGTGFANGLTGTSAGTADDASSYVADDTEYNSLNTDRELYAIRDIARSLGHVDQRKSLLYFSGGLTRNGIENQASMRAATNEAVKANMAIYSVDARGLQAIPPVGDASTGSLRGNAAYSSAAMQSGLAANFSSQEVLGTLSSDTGGKAFLDSNDFAPAFQQIQHDTEAYYIIGFRSTNTAKDGTFRHLTVKLNRNDLKDVKLDYRPGYYAQADFQHSKNEDRELQLTEQLRSDFPATDVSLYLQALYFRMDDGRFFVPVSLIVPGSQIPFLKNGDRDKANIDVIGQVKNAEGIIVGNVRDTVKLALDQAQQVKRKNIQYSTGFTLAPGKYHLKFVVRENQTGAMGSFETDLQVPDLKKIPLKLSSIVLASQRVTNNDKKSTNPLVRDGFEWIPNLPHVFRQDQHLYFLYEVYDPSRVKADGSKPEAPAPGMKRRDSGPVRVLTSIEFLSGGVKVYETPLVEAKAVNELSRNAVQFQFDVALSQLTPGNYICQVNVIDDAGGSFTFPRMALRVQPGTPPAAVPAAPAASQTAPSGKPGQ
jgi:VWFA-related protein